MIRRETVVALTLCTAAASALAFLSACGGGTPATSFGYVRMPPGAYMTTCFPAQF